MRAYPRTFLFELFLLLAVLFSYTSAKAQFTFQRVYGGSADENGFDILSTFDQGFLLVGDTKSFGGGDSCTNPPCTDFYVVKTDQYGDEVWSYAYGGPYDDQAYDAIQTADSGFVILGHSRSYSGGAQAVYLVKIDKDGNEVWSRSYLDNYDDYGFSLSPTSDGGFLIVGCSGVMSSYNDVLVVKIDGVGDSLWSRTFSDTQNDIAWEGYETNDGGYILAGETQTNGSGGLLADGYVIKLNSSGDTLWTRKYGHPDFVDAFNSSIETSDGGLVFLGNTMAYGAGNTDVLLVKTDPVGDTLWTRTYGGGALDIGNKVVETLDQGLVIIGTTQSFGAGTVNIYLIRTDANGDTLWTRVYGDTLTSFGYGMVLTADSGFALIGKSSRVSISNSDLYLLKIDKNGNTYCSDSLGTNTFLSRAPFTIGGGASVSSGVTIDSASIGSKPLTSIDSVICSDVCYVAIAGFMTKVTSVSGQINVDFFDLSSYALSWFWDFGDGNTDTIQNPLHIYADTGTYTVCLSVAGACDSDTFCMSVVAYCELPQASFTYISNGLVYDFIDSSSNAANWFWDFGDGNQSTLQQPFNQYAGNGTYDVCLVVTNDCGADSICSQVVVNCNFPVAAFFADTVGTTGLAYAFSDSSIDADSWLWDFGDSAQSIEQNPLHTYTDSGLYLVCLTVSNICGSDTICENVWVQPLPTDGIGYKAEPRVVLVFPNPFSSTTTIELPAHDRIRYSELTVFNTIGEIMEIHDLANKSQFILHAEHLEAGVYILRITTGDGPSYQGRAVIIR